MSEHATTMWSLVGQIAMIMLAGGGLIMLEHLRQRALDWYNQRKLHPIARSVLANKEVNSLLIELRAKTEADRACVFLFHNGQIFSNKNPLWRVSCTQECCRTGISHEIGSMQNTLSALLWEGLAPLFSTDPKDFGPGISGHFAMGGTIRIYKFAAHDLNDGFFKRSLLARGIRIAYLSPIFDSHKEIVGYCSLDYGPEQEPSPEQIITTLAEAAGNIHYALTTV